VGRAGYQVVAFNKDGRRGKSVAGTITVEKKPGELVNVAKLSVNPNKGYSGEKFAFRANTDRPAQGVSLIVGGERFEMRGSGTAWTLDRKMAKPGELVVSAIATNEDGVEGSLMTAQLIVEQLTERFACNKDGTVKDRKTGEVMERFSDNRDGTVTDRCTKLMWLKEPKGTANTWAEATMYCRSLVVGRNKGWRLPTLEEWNALVDQAQENPALPLEHPFSDVHTHMAYWSKTKHPFGPLYVYQMDLWNGQSRYASKKKNGNIWPVRYAD
jgi:hypothetical protein